MTFLSEVIGSTVGHDGRRDQRLRLRRLDVKGRLAAVYCNRPLEDKSGS